MFFNSNKLSFLLKRFYLNQKNIYFESNKKVRKNDLEKNFLRNMTEKN